MRRFVKAAFASFFIVLTVLNLSFDARAERPSELRISAKSAVLIEASTGRCLYEKNADEKRPMASTTKIMTAVAAIEHGRLTDAVKVKAGTVKVEGSSMYLAPGEELTLEELLYGLMLSSGNDAANVIAEHVGGSIADFVKLMNETAKKLNLSSTSFANPSGLDAAGHYTTARDLAMLTRYAINNLPEFSKIVSTYSINVSRNSAPNGRRLVNHNRLLRTYEGAIGVKTGYTSQAGRCLVSAAERNGVKLIAVTLSAPDDWRDHKALLDYGFSVAERKKIVDKGVMSQTIPVISGDMEEIEVAITREISCVLFGEENLEIVYELPRFVYAPIEENRRIGCVKVYYPDGTLAGESDIVSIYTVNSIKPRENIFTKLWRAIQSFFDNLFG